MNDSTKDKDKFETELLLNCNAKHALGVLSASLDHILLPWFMTKTSIKGIIYKNKFLVWPNTIYSNITDIVVTGEIVPNGDKSCLKATSRLLPPFNLFKSKQLVNWFFGIFMVISWCCVAIGMVFDKEVIINIAFPILIIATLYIFIQFTRFIQNPELVDLHKRFHKIFKNYIANS
jgi:hypothetical protein